MHSQEHPLITVLMPVYNAQNDLRGAIDSILNQSYPHFEFLIIDDGSSDESANIIRSYRDSRIRFLQNERNVKLVATLNRGIKEANGRYIARMDADDLSLSRRLELQVALLEEKNADICGSFFEVISEGGAFIRSISAPLAPDTVVACLANTVPFAHGSAMLRRSFLLEHDLRYTPGIDAEDFDLWIRMFEAGAKFVNCPQSLYQYREYAVSLSKIRRKGYADASMQFRRRFVAQNRVQCEQALKNLLPQKNVLEYRDQLNMVCLAFRIWRAGGKLTPFLKALFGVPPKAMAHSLYRLWYA